MNFDASGPKYITPVFGFLVSGVSTPHNLIRVWSYLPSGTAISSVSPSIAFITIAALSLYFSKSDIAELSVVGVGMRTHYGVADKLFGALAKAKVNIDSITTSEIRISCIVDKKQAEKALEAVCLAFELDKPAEKRKQAK